MGNDEIEEWRIIFSREEREINADKNGEYRHNACCQGVGRD